MNKENNSAPLSGGLQMNNHKDCPLCNQAIISDASKIQSCTLCGMVVDSRNMIMLVQESEEQYFCSDACYEEYSTIHADEGELNGR